MGEIGDLTALCLQRGGECGIIHHSLHCGHDTGLLYFPFPSVSLFVYLLVFCVFLGPIIWSSASNLLISLPPLLSHCVSQRFLTRQTSHTTSHLSAPVRPGPIEFAVFPCVTPLPVLSALCFFLCDRRIALSCSDYSTVAVWSLYTRTAISTKTTLCDRTPRTRP